MGLDPRTLNFSPFLFLLHNATPQGTLSLCVSLDIICKLHWQVPQADGQAGAGSVCLFPVQRRYQRDFLLFPQVVIYAAIASISSWVFKSII